jgi:hypothetical protein
VDHLFLQTDHPSTVPYDTRPYPDVDVKDSPKAQPDNFTLEQNFPNPFNPSTTISYALAVRANVSLKIYDMLGREIRTLVAEDRQPALTGLNGTGLMAGEQVRPASISIP